MWNRSDVVMSETEQREEQQRSQRNESTECEDDEDDGGGGDLHLRLNPVEVRAAVSAGRSRSGLNGVANQERTHSCVCVTPELCLNLDTSVSKLLMWK